MRTTRVRTLTITLGLAVACALVRPAASVHAQSAGALTLTGGQTGPLDPQVSTGILSAGRRSPSTERRWRPRSTAAWTTSCGRPRRRFASSSSSGPSKARRPPSEPKCASSTTVRTLLCDYAHYSDRKLIRANLVDRDQTAGDDNVRLYFDPFLDQQRAYVFSVNGYGIQSDSVLNSADASTGTAADLTPGVRGVVPVNNFGGCPVPEKRGGLLDRIRRAVVRPNYMSGGRRSGAPGDSFWDALFESAGTGVDDGWTAEIAIPFKSLGYPAPRDRGGAPLGVPD